MATTRQVEPNWYTDEDRSAWDRVKSAFRRDWRQTKHDFGGTEPDLKQNVTDTISQATGSKPIPPANTPTRNVEVVAESNPDYSNKETGFRYGYAAYRHYGSACDWSTDLETQLRSDFKDDADWHQHRAAVRQGWFYAKQSCCDKP